MFRFCSEDLVDPLGYQFILDSDDFIDNILLLFLFHFPLARAEGQFLWVVIHGFFLITSFPAAGVYAWHTSLETFFY